jgi:hypothetical protein
VAVQDCPWDEQNGTTNCSARSTRCVSSYTRSGDKLILMASDDHKGTGLVDLQPESKRARPAEESRRVQGSHWRGESAARLS